MPATSHNQRRPRLRQRLAKAWRAISIGWDFHLFTVGYGILFGLLGIAALWLPDVNQTTLSWQGAAPAEAAPGAEHWFGLGRGGTDMMIPTLKQSGISIWLSLIATTGGALVGLGLGTVFSCLSRDRGYRLLDWVAQSVSATPAMILALALAWGFGTGFWVVAFILGSFCTIHVAGRTAWWYREMEWQGHVLASRSIGWTRWRLIADHLFTHFWKRAAAMAATLLPGVLLAESAIGFALDGQGRIGHLLAQGRQNLFEAPWLIIFPGLFLSIIIMLLAAFGWAVRRTVDEPLEERIW